MDFNLSDSATFSALDQQLSNLEVVVERIHTYLQQTRPAVLPSLVYEGVAQVTGQLAQLRKNINMLEEERRSLRALAQIGSVVNSSLELDIVLQIVMDTIIRLTGAERSILMLRNDDGELSTRVGRNWEQETLETSEQEISRTVIYRVADEGQPVLTTNAQEDPRFTGQNSVVAYNLRSILCVPLKVKDQITGVIYADNRVREGIFTRKELDLLTGFSNQAAVALENARLFESVRQTLAEVTELKNLMDNVFSSMASGVLTADIQERILLCNQAAERILGMGSKNVVGLGISEVVPPLIPVIRPHMEQILRSGAPVIGLEASPRLEEKGQVDLSLSLAPLKDAQRNTQGVAIVLEDLTEKKRLEGQRRLFERMVSPGVIDQLNPDSLHLGGRKNEITVLFADLRGFTEFSEKLQPEELVAVLNQYLAAAAEAVLNEEGTIDKFLGDAVMSWFNAPVPQPDHTLRAVKTALAIRMAVGCLHENMPAAWKLNFGIGIHYGQAVLGLIGTEKRMEYTAIGDCVNTARRIQENAQPGQILISQQAYELVKGQAFVRPVEPIQAKGKRDPIPVYEVIGLK